MRHESALDRDVAAWKVQVARVATTFDLLALAASASEQLAHLTDPTAPTTPTISSGVAPLSHVVASLASLAASSTFQPVTANSTLGGLLREMRATVDHTRRLLQRPTPPAPHPRDDASFLLRDYIPRLERALSALEQLYVRMPLISSAAALAAAPSEVPAPPDLPATEASTQTPTQAPTQLPPGRTGTTPPPAPGGRFPTAR